MNPQELVDQMPESDLGVIAQAVGAAVKTQTRPDWQAEFRKLSDIGRHLLGRAPAPAVMAAAFATWVNAAPNFIARSTRNSKARLAIREHGAAIRREIEAAQVTLAAERAA